MSTNNNSRNAILCMFIMLILIIRIFAPLSEDFKAIANFSGLGALALFTGSYFKNRIAGFAIAMISLFLSDLGLAVTMGKAYGFYQGWYYTYIAFALMVLVGQQTLKKVSVATVLSSSLLAVLIHWIVADFGVWYGSTFYPQTVGGFWACLVAAIPFELNFLYGTLLYSTLMFGLFETLKVKFPALRLARA